MKRSVGKERDCEHCGERFLALQEFASYKRKFCSLGCSGAAIAAKRHAKYPPREEVWHAYEIEAVTDREFGARYGRTYQWALNVRRHYGIEALSQRDKTLRRNGGPSRRVASHGYVVVSTPDGQEYEHRLVAERKLGRSLKPGEVVHHIDGDKANNSPENLQVFADNGVHHRQAHPKQKKPRTKADHSVWRDFRLELKGEECCRNCGAPACDLHHAIPRSMHMASRTNLLNGLPLCRRCHQGWHHRKVTLCRDLFTAEEWEYLSAVELTGQRIEAWLDDRYPASPSPRGSEA